MTRINLVPVTELCDQHLLAEHRELTRIPNGIVSGKLKPKYKDAPKQYTLGPGHVKFFVDKLEWLFNRHWELSVECSKRGFQVQDIWPYGGGLPASCYNNYVPTKEEIELNRARIIERMPTRPRYFGGYLKWPHIFVK